MDFFSHFLFGIFISATVLKSLRVEFVIYSGFMAVMADFDIILEPLQKIRKSLLLSHKGASHSYITALGVSAITGGLFAIITNTSFLLAWMIGFMFYSLHVTLDFLTASKIPLFYPISKRKFRFFVDRAINPLLAMFSGSTILFYFIVYFIFPTLYFNDTMRIFFLCFYVAYLTFRIVAKATIQAQLPKNAHYIPGVFPFTCLIYENRVSDNIISFRLSKKFIFFSKPHQIIERSIETSSREMDFYKKALSLSEKYVFFTKWEYRIPIISQDDKHLRIILFLADSFTAGSVYFLKVIFDKRTGEVFEETDAFDFIMRKKNKKYELMV